MFAELASTNPNFLAKRLQICALVISKLCKNNEFSNICKKDSNIYDLKNQDMYSNEKS